MNVDWRAWPRAPRATTDVYVPAQVAVDFREQLGVWDQLEYMQSGLGTVAIHELADGDEFTLGTTTVRPFRLAEDYVYAFLLEDGDRRVLIAPDELNGWKPGQNAKGVDVAVLPMGICEFHPLTGERLIHQDHQMLQLEATFEETLDIVRQLGAGRVYLTHIEEMDQLGYDDLEKVGSRLRDEGLPVEVAHDTLVVEI